MTTSAERRAAERATKRVNELRRSDPRETRANIWEEMKSLLDQCGDEMTAEQAARYDVMEAAVDKLTEQIDGAPAAPRDGDRQERHAAHAAKLDALDPVPSFGSGRTGEYRAGVPLTHGQSFAGYVQARDLGPRDDLSGVTFDQYARGLATGRWGDVDPILRNAMTEGTATAGGHLVPAPLAAQIIDLARAQTRVLQAGALLVPMESATLKIARIAGDPTAAWHSEAATIAPSDATLDAVTFTARVLASRVLVSRELLEDAPNVGTELARIFAAQLALTIDKAALYGSGTAPEPRGVKNVAAVTKTSMGANGATVTYDALVDSVYRVRGANETPSGMVYAVRTGQTLAKVKDTQGQYLTPPVALSDVPRFETTQVPINLTVGTSTDTSDVFTADFSQLLLGLRTDLEITVLRERSADAGMVEFLAWWRGDVQVARATAFDVVTGVRP